MLFIKSSNGGGEISDWVRSQAFVPKLLQSCDAKSAKHDSQMRA